jgi:hypothetical protein
LVEVLEPTAPDSYFAWIFSIPFCSRKKVLVIMCLKMWQPRYAPYLRLCPNENGHLVSCEEEEDEPSTYQGTPDDHVGKTSILYLIQEVGTRYNLMPRLWVYGGVDISYRLYSQVYLPSWSIRYVPVEGEGEPNGLL